MKARSNSRSPIAAVASIAVLLALLAGAASAPAKPRPGTIERSFSGDGLVHQGFGTEPGWGGAIQVVMQPDGRALVLARNTRSNVIVRYLPDGSVDTSFGEAGFATTDFKVPLSHPWVSKIALQADGKVVLVGGFEVPDANADSVIAVARLLPDGSPDPAFVQGGVVSFDGARSGSGAGEGVFALPDGDLILVDRVDPVGKGSGIETVRLNSDGSLDRGYGDRGFGFIPAPANYFNGLLEQLAIHDGEVTIVQSSVGGGGRTLIMRFNAGGQADKSLGGDGTVLTGVVGNAGSGIAVDPAGRILAAGTGGTVARFLADGSPDPSFGSGGLSTFAESGFSQEVRLALSADGGIVLAGKTGWKPAPETADFVVARLQANGSLDPGFDGEGYATTDIGGGSVDGGEDLAILPDGRILVVGGTEPAERGQYVAKIALARYLPDGGLDPSFGGGGIVTTTPRRPARDEVAALTVDREGRAIAVGTAGGQVGVVRYLPDGKPDPSFGTGGTALFNPTPSPLGNRGESLLAYPDGSLLLGSGSGLGGALIRLGPNGSPDPGFGTDGVLVTSVIAHVQDLELSDGRILAVGFAYEPCRVVLARFNADGTLDPSFGKGGQLQVAWLAGPCRPRDVELETSSKGRIFVAGTSNWRFLQVYEPDGTRVEDFGRDGKHSVGRVLPKQLRALAVDRAGRVLAGGRIGNRLGVVRLRPSGALDKSFGKGGFATEKIGPSSAVSELLVEDGGRIVAAGASRTRTSGIWDYFVSRPFVVRFNKDGSPDRHFGAGGSWSRPVGVSSAFGALALGPDAIVAGGWTLATGQDHQFLLAKLRR